MGCIFSSPRFKVSQIDLSFWTLCFYNLAVIPVDYIQTCPSTCTVMYLIAVNLCEHAMCPRCPCSMYPYIYREANCNPLIHSLYMCNSKCLRYMLSHLWGLSVALVLIKTLILMVRDSRTVQVLATATLKRIFIVLLTESSTKCNPF
ncbi:hypothetical protein EB796_017917 [Bugula neritina]|uniref:Uncharacterized protein n=1 Tax=Bugula neritina TaxID=10212 RepID=A0A7J7JCW7_BUGNE|nr:hypothetical protein EB796_017917 [Bugula neritina]